MAADPPRHPWWELPADPPPPKPPKRYRDPAQRPGTPADEEYARYLSRNQPDDLRHSLEWYASQGMIKVQHPPWDCDTVGKATTLEAAIEAAARMDGPYFRARDCIRWWILTHGMDYSAERHLSFNRAWLVHHPAS